VHLHQLCALKLSTPHHVLCVFWGVCSEQMAVELPLSSTGSLINLSANKTLDLQAMRPALKFALANRSVQTLALLMTHCPGQEPWRPTHWHRPDLEAAPSQNSCRHDWSPSHNSMWGRPALLWPESRHRRWHSRNGSTLETHG